MSVFAAAMDRIFTQADMASPALWISATTSEERPIRIIRRAPDRVTDFGAGRFVSDTTVVYVRVAGSFGSRPRSFTCLRVVPSFKATSGRRSKASVGVERHRGRGLKARGGRRETTGKVLKDRRSPRERGRMGTSV